MVLISFPMRFHGKGKSPFNQPSILALITNFTFELILIYGRFWHAENGSGRCSGGELFVSGIVNLIVLLTFLLRDKNTLVLKLREMFCMGRRIPENISEQMLSDHLQMSFLRNRTDADKCCYRKTE